MLFTQPPTTYFCFFSLVFLSPIAQICVFPLIQLDKKRECRGYLFEKYELTKSDKVSENQLDKR